MKMCKKVSIKIRGFKGAAADNGAAFAVKVKHCRITEQIFFHIISLPCCDFCLKNYIKIQLQ